MLATTVLMLVIAFYNRYSAKTIHHPDSPLLLVGAILEIVCFALFAIAVKDGFGQHVRVLNISATTHLKKVGADIRPSLREMADQL